MISIDEPLVHHLLQSNLFEITNNNQKRTKSKLFFNWSEKSSIGHRFDWRVEERIVDKHLDARDEQRAVDAQIADGDVRCEQFDHALFVGVAVANHELRRVRRNAVGAGANLVTTQHQQRRIAAVEHAKVAHIEARRQARRRHEVHIAARRHFDVVHRHVREAAYRCDIGVVDLTQRHILHRQPINICDLKSMIDIQISKLTICFSEPKKFRKQNRVISQTTNIKQIKKPRYSSYD